jgi:hypothetical protein
MIKTTLLMLVLAYTFTVTAQSTMGNNFAFMDKEDIEMFNKDIGELFMSSENFSIDDFILFKGLKFIASKDWPNEVRLFDLDNTLIDKVKIREKDKGFVGLYRTKEDVYFARRPQNGKVYQLMFDALKPLRIKKKALEIPISDLGYFSKIVVRDNIFLFLVDFRSSTKGNNEIESAIFIKSDNAQLDTLAVINYQDGTNAVLQPLSSWTFDISEINNSNHFVLQNFRTGHISVIDRSGEELNSINISELLLTHDLKPYYQYLLGRRNYFNKVLNDYNEKNTFLYTGGINQDGTYEAVLFKWNVEQLKWLRVSIQNGGKPYPFVNLLSIDSQKLYFTLEDKFGNKGIYKKELN